MLIKTNAAYLIAMLLIFVALKAAYLNCTIEQLYFLLFPVNKIVEIVCNKTAIYNPNQGFYFPNYQIIIEKTCSGFNFLLLCFVMLNSLALQFLKTTLQKILALPFFLLLSYLLTIFVNSSRILTSIVVQNAANNFLFTQQHFLLHQIVGVSINLFYLILFYLAFNCLFIKIKHKL